MNENKEKIRLKIEAIKKELDALELTGTERDTVIVEKIKKLTTEKMRRVNLYNSL